MDEIVQVCQAEIQGITVAVKATVQVAQWIFRLLRWLCTKEMEQRLNMPGCHKFSDIMKLSDGEMPQVLDIPEKDVAGLIAFARSHDLHLSLLPDLNVNDGKTQFVIPPKEAALFVSYTKSCAQREKAELDSVMEKYTTEEAELTEKLRHATGDTTALQNHLDIVKERNREFGIRVENVQKMIDEGGLCDINDYLRTGKGSMLDENLEKGMAAYEKGLDVSAKYSMQECMGPVRDPGNIPIERFRFILPDQGVVVTREYKVDKDTNIAYSEYSFTTAEGEKCKFSDKNIPKERWNTEELPKIFDKIGCDADTPAKVFRNIDGLKKYFNLSKGKDIIPNVIKKAKEKGFNVENFNNAEVGKQLQVDKVESMKEKASAEINGDKTMEKYRVPVDSFFFTEGAAYIFDRTTGQEVCLGTKDDISELKPVAGEENPGVAKYWEFSFDKNKSLSCEDRFTGEKYSMSLDEGAKQGKFDFSEKKTERKESATNEITEAAQNMIHKGQSRHH